MALTKIKADGLTADLIDETKLADNSIDSEHYNDGSIDTAHIAADQITGALIADDAVDTEHLAANSVGTGAIAPYSVSTEHITNDAVTAAKLANSINDDLASKAVLTGSTNNQITTVTGANTFQGEAGLTFDGTTLNVAGTNSEIHILGSGTCDHSISSPSGTNDVVITANKDAENVTSNIVFKSSGTGGGAVSEKLRIDSSGNLGINETTPVNKLTISNEYQQTDSVGNLQIRYTGSDGANNSGLTVKNYKGTSQFMQWSDGGLRIGSRILTNSGAGNIYFTTGSDSVKAVLLASNGNLELSAGNLVVGNGKGIDFGAASNAAGMTSELLDDYEEGTFSPYIRGTGGSAGSYAQFGLNGKYTKIGNMVHFTMQSVLSNKGSYSGNFKFGGLPYTAAASNYAVAINMYPSTNVDGVMRTARVNNGQDFGYVMSGSRLDIPAPYSEIVTGYYFSVAGTYQAA